MSDTALLQAALEYARRGWRVLPLKTGEKTPNGGLVPTDTKTQQLT